LESSLLAHPLELPWLLQVASASSPAPVAQKALESPGNHLIIPIQASPIIGISEYHGISIVSRSKFQSQSHAIPRVSLAFSSAVSSSFTPREKWLEDLRLLSFLDLF